MSENKDLNPDVKKLVDALCLGPIQAIGQVVYNKRMEQIFWTTDLYYAIRDANKMGIKVGRTDAGGKPTWDLKK